MPIQFQTDFANLEGTVKELREGENCFDISVNTCVVG